MIRATNLSFLFKKIVWASFFALPIWVMAQAPTPNFTADVTEGCDGVPTLVTFQDQSVGNPTAWLWDFGNGETSTQQNPQFIYNNAGSYDVRLTVTNADGSRTVTKSSFIEIAESPTVVLPTISAGSVCPPVEVQFTDNSTSPASFIQQWFWSFSDGSFDTVRNPLIRFTRSGSIDLTLTVTDGNGCTATERFTQILDLSEGAPEANFTADQVGACESPITVNFTNTTSEGGQVVEYVWSFPGGTPNSFAGSSPPPIAYDVQGNYDVTLIVTNQNGCKDTASLPSFIGIGNTVVDFDAASTTVCVGDSVNFINTSQGATENLRWDFGDGNISTDTNPVHFYDTEGVYAVKLSATNAEGCGDSTTKPSFIRVLTPPEAAFSLDTPSVCTTPVTINFTDESLGGNAWSWEFGDGGTSTSRNPSHIYTAEGKYEICLTVESGSGCRDTRCENTTISTAKPQILFNATPAQGCAPLTTTFTDMSEVIGGGEIRSWQWEFFGEGVSISSSDSPGPTVTYDSTGEYSVRLIAGTANGCVDSLTLFNYIRVGTPPDTIDFEASDSLVCVKIDPVNFTSLIPPGVDTTDWDFYWDFEYEPGDFTRMSEEVNPTHTYSEPDTYSVALVIDFQGCTDTIIKQDLIIVQPPQALFAVGEELVCELPKQIILENQSVGPADQYIWFFDGAQISTDSIPPPVTINSFGRHDIRLIAINNQNGCRDTFDAFINTGIAVADFSTPDVLGCGPHEVQFQNNSSAAVVSYAWEFGNGGTSSAAAPSFIYEESGLYSVKLKVTDAFGCVDSLTRTDYIRVGGANVNFVSDIEVGCPPLAATFTDSSTSANTVTNWQWDFGDPTSASNTSNQQNPVHIYESEGQFDVTLIVTDNDNCTDTLTQASFINVSFPSVDFAVDDSSTCAGNLLNFINNSTGSGATYFWDFGDGGTSQIPNPTYAYTTPGTYTVKLVATDQNGCQDSLIKTNYIEIEGITADFDGRITGDPNFTTTPLGGLCPPLSVEFRNLSTGNIASYLWEFGDGALSPLEDPGYTYTQSGVFDVSLTVTHEDGCIERNVIREYIQLGGPLGEFSVDQTGYCVGDTVVMQVVSDKACQLFLDFRDGSVENRVASCIPGIADTTIIKHVYNNPGKYSPAVVLRDASLCAIPLELPDTIRIFDFPTANFQAVDSVGCAPFDAEFINLSSSVDTVFAPIISNVWRFGDGSFSTEIQPVNTFLDTGVFAVQLTIEDINGCADSVTRNIRIVEGVRANFVASDTFNCAPIDILFSPQVLNGATANSWQWSFGDGGIDSVETPTHNYTDNGFFDVSLIIGDNLGCTDTITKLQYINLRGPEAVARLSRDFACIPSEITFYGDSTISDTAIARYDWCVTTLSNGFTVCEPSPSGRDSLRYLFTTAGDFSIQLIATDIFGCQDSSVAVPLTIANIARPEPIEMRSVSVVSDDQVVVSFNPYPGTDFIDYAVYRFDGNTPILVGNITDQFATTFVDTLSGLDTRENVYCYKVLVKNICEEYSSLADTEEHCTVELAASSGEDEIILTWNPYEGFEVDQYFIYRAEDYDLSSLVNIGIVEGDVLAFTDTNTFCYDSVTYRLMATALNSNNVQSFSDITIGAPIHNPPTEGHPIAYVSVIDDNDIEVSWPNYNGYKPQEYFLERSLDGILWDSLTVLPRDVTTYLDTTVEVNIVPYYYRVSVLDSCGDRTPLGLIGKSILLDTQLTFNENDPQLNWDRYFEWGQGVLNYQIEVLNENTGQFETVAVVSRNALQYQDRKTRLNQGTYCYRIRAFEAGGLGSSSLSNVSCVTFNPQVFAPTAFSPNDDGRNDNFRVFVPNLRNAELSIYDRWGKLLFRTLDLTDSWDGKYQGRSVTEGVYVYVISGTGTDGLGFNRSGTITLVR